MGNSEETAILHTVYGHQVSSFYKDSLKTSRLSRISPQCKTHQSKPVVVVRHPEPRRRLMVVGDEDEELTHAPPHPSRLQNLQGPAHTDMVDQNYVPPPGLKEANQRR